MATNPLFIEASAGAPAYTSASYRQGLSALLAGPSPVQIFSGVRCGTITVVGTAITIPAPVSYVLNGGNAPGSEGFYAGAFISGDADLAKTLTAAHATLDRIDRILVRVYNTDLDSSTFRRQNIEYQVGTPASSPVAPTLPTGSVYEIALISVPHSGGGSPSVTMTARPPVAAGGARNGTGSNIGDLEIYHIPTGTWKRVAQDVGAHFQGGYDPGTASNIANNTWTSVPTTSTVTSSRVTLVSGNSLRIDEAGLYQCNGQVRLNTGSASGTGRARFTVNGTEMRQANTPLITGAFTINLACQLRLAAADVLRFEVQQDQGSARQFANGVNYNFIDIARVS